MLSLLTGGLSALAGVASVGQGIVSSYLNYKQQKDQFNWNKQQAVLQMQREDTATQRRVADLKAAGLSPTLAAGQPAVASAPQVSGAPQIDYKQTMSQAAQDVLTILQQKENIAQSRLQQEVTKTQKLLNEINTLKASHEIGMVDSRALQARMEANKAAYDASIKAQDLKIMKATGLGSKTTDAGQAAKDLVGPGLLMQEKQAIEKEQKKQKEIKHIKQNPVPRKDWRLTSPDEPDTYK